jgi:hypothetical protein
MISRNYKTKDVEMLMASRTVATNLSNNLEDLSLVRSNWTADYVTQLQTKIDNAIENYLGLDKKKDLRDATALVTSIQSTAKRELSFLKTQIEVDFPGTKDEILKNLGYSANFRKVQNNNQEALIELLYAFKKGMTDELKAQIVEKGTNAALIEKIISYADQLKEADSTQEALKKSASVVSEEAITVFNEIYNEIIGICKIASNFYQDDPVKKAMFTFTQIVAAMSASGKSTKEGTSVEAGA